MGCRPGWRAGISSGARGCAMEVAGLFSLRNAAWMNWTEPSHLVAESRVFLVFSQLKRKHPGHLCEPWDSEHTLVDDIQQPKQRIECYRPSKRCGEQRCEMPILNAPNSEKATQER